MKAEREAFEEEHKLPSSNESIAAVFVYASTLHKARPSLLKAHEKLIDGYGKSGDKAAERKAQIELTEFKTAIPGSADFVSGSNWNGILDKGNNTTNISITFNEVKNTIMKGRIRLNNNWCQMDFEGLREGPYYVTLHTKMVIGEPQTPTFQGFVLGDRMIISVTGLRGKRGPVSGLAVLTRAGKP